MTVDADVTVLMPTSPIPAHPSTSVIDETVASVRAHLPDARLLVMVDRPAIDPVRGLAFDEYRRRVCRRAGDGSWGPGPVLPILHRTHLHQRWMTLDALYRFVDTPLVLFVEHDTPLTADRPIPWAGLAGVIRSGAIDLIRLHHEASVLEPHRHLMLGDGPRPFGDGVPLWPTVQWSQRPHLASAAFYRTVIEGPWWRPADGMIEDRMHSVVQSAYADHGQAGWEQFRLALFHPDGDIKRSTHLDGRAGDPKVTFAG